MNRNGWLLLLQLTTFYLSIKISSGGRLLIDNFVNSAGEKLKEILYLCEKYNFFYDL